MTVSPAGTINEGLNLTASLTRGFSGQFGLGVGTSTGIITEYGMGYSVGGTSVALTVSVGEVLAASAAFATISAGGANKRLSAVTRRMMENQTLHQLWIDSGYYVNSVLGIYAIVRRRAIVKYAGSFRMNREWYDDEKSRGLAEKFVIGVGATMFIGSVLSLIWLHWPEGAFGYVEALLSPRVIREPWEGLPDRWAT